MRKFSISILLIIISLLVFCACTKTNNGDKNHKVMVTVDSGATVTSQNPIEVAHGSDCEFDISLGSTFVFVSSSHGTYDADTGKLTVKNVTERMNITFVTEDVGYDTTEEILYIFTGASCDETNIKSMDNIRFGTAITVEANNTERIFAGWTVGKALTAGAEILSTDRNYTLRAHPDMVVNGAIRVYANYKDTNILYYNSNGGTVNSASENMKKSEYYTASVSGDTIEVKLTEKYISYAECASTFWNDGTFTRAGYVLTEYNTKADGSGESYSLGSKVYTVDGNNHTTLYCIWEKESEGFEYLDFEFARPAGITEKNSPEWNTSGVVITKYNGSDEKVVVPERIGNKPVIAIAENAFVSKNMKTLVLPRHLLSVADGAVKSCTNLSTLYFSDGVYEMTDNAFDEASMKNLKNFYVNASICPRFSATSDGAFAVKLSRLLASEDRNRIIVISGSSSYLGLSTEYFEALLDNEYRVINFGTTRTTHGTIYLEAMSKLAHEGDIVIYAPENSSYMFGETELYWKTLRDLEGMYNFYRCIDISNYTGVFSAFSDFNKSYRYKREPKPYELICTTGYTDKYGDRDEADMAKYVDLTEYSDSYCVTFTDKVKSKFDTVSWKDEEYHQNNKDYNNPENITWCSMKEEYMLQLMNRAINSAKSSGAKVYFATAPTDASSIAQDSQNLAALAAYDELIKSIYCFDGLLGSSENYVYNRKYFHDCAFHTNDYGRAYRTYDMYLDIMVLSGNTDVYGMLDLGVNFDGCLFEESTDGNPLTGVPFIEENQ